MNLFEKIFQGSISVHGNLELLGSLTRDDKILLDIINENLLIGQSGNKDITGTYNISIGDSAASSITSGIKNITIGRNAGALITTGNESIIIGDSAGKSIIQASRNILLGSNTGENITSGSDNVLLGHNTGSSNLVGNNNIFLGTYTGMNATISDLVLIGTWAGNNLTTGAQNTLVGHQSGFNVTTGRNNTYFGYYSGHANQLGSYNTYIGSNAGYQNADGSYNTFIGDDNGSISGSYNTFLGQGVGRVTTGNHNTFLGYNTGSQNTSGYNNIFLGSNSGIDNTIGHNNIFAGIDAGVNNTEGSFNIFLGNESGMSNLTGTNNITLGKGSGKGLTSASYNILLGYYAGKSITTGGDNIVFGNSAFNNALTTINNIAIGLYAANSATSGDNAVIIGSNAGRYSTGIDGSIYIGASAGQYKHGVNNVIIGTDAGSDDFGTGNDVNHSVFIGYKAGQAENNANRLHIASHDTGITDSLIYGEFDNKLLQVNGKLVITDYIKIGAYTSGATGGEIEFDGTDFKGYNGTEWVKLNTTQGVDGATGNDQEIQYNNNGAFGATSTFKYNASLNALTIGNRYGTTNTGSVVIANRGEANGVGAIASGYTTINYMNIKANGTSAFNHSGITSTGYNEVGANASYSAILGGVNNSIQNTADRSVVLGGDGIDATESDKVYVPGLISQGYVRVGLSADSGVNGDLKYQPGTGFMGYHGGTWVEFGGGVNNFVDLVDVDTITNNELIYKNGTTGLISSTPDFQYNPSTKSIYHNNLNGIYINNATPIIVNETNTNEIFRINTKTNYFTIGSNISVPDNVLNDKNILIGKNISASSDLQEEFKQIVIGSDISLRTRNGNTTNADIAIGHSITTGGTQRRSTITIGSNITTSYYHTSTIIGHSIADDKISFADAVAIGNNLFKLHTDKTSGQLYQSVAIGNNIGNVSGIGNYRYSIIAGYNINGVKDISHSVILGHQAGGNNKEHSNENIFIGSYAAYGPADTAETRGNTIIGPNASHNGRIGNGNIYLGFRTGTDNVNVAENQILRIGNQRVTADFDYGTPNDPLLYGNMVTGHLKINNRLEVVEELKIGNKDAGTIAEAGMVQWNGTNFQGYDGTSWKNLDTVQAPPEITTISGSITEYNKGRILFEDTDKLTDSEQFIWDADRNSLLIGQEWLGETRGINSISIGAINRIRGDYSAGIGSNVLIDGDYALGSGKDISITTNGDSGVALGNKLEVDALASVALGNNGTHTVYVKGVGAFSMQKATVDNVEVFGANSAVLGGMNNTTTSAAPRSVVLGGNGIQATKADRVYVPTLESKAGVVLSTNNSVATETGMVTYDGTNFKGYNGTSWVNFDEAVATTFINKTHAELLSMLQSNQLVENTHYKITDFKTMYRIKILNDQDYQTSEEASLPIIPEPLVVFATSNNTLAPIAYSLLHPSDYIEYDITPQDLKNTNTDVTVQNKGRIVLRRDKYGVECNFDWRNMYSQVASFAINTPADNTSISAFQVVADDNMYYATEEYFSNNYTFPHENIRPLIKRNSNVLNDSLTPTVNSMGVHMGVTGHKYVKMFPVEEYEYANVRIYTGNNSIETGGWDNYYNHLTDSPNVTFVYGRASNVYIGNVYNTYFASDGFRDGSSSSSSSSSSGSGSDKFAEAEIFDFECQRAENSIIYANESSCNTINSILGAYIFCSQMHYNVISKIIDSILIMDYSIEGNRFEEIRSSYIGTTGFEQNKGFLISSRISNNQSIAYNDIVSLLPFRTYRSGQSEPMKHNVINGRCQLLEVKGEFNNNTINRLGTNKRIIFNNNIKDTLIADKVGDNLGGTINIDWDLTACTIDTGRILNTDQTQSVTLSNKKISRCNDSNEYFYENIAADGSLTVTKIV